jgi:hypothetical protein
MGTAYLTDPLLQTIDVDEMPTTFINMDDDQQRWRGRLYLKYLWGFHDKAFAWVNALTDDEAEYRPGVDATDDETIFAMMRGYATEIGEARFEG